MAFDDVLGTYVGEIGRYQIVMILMINICMVPGAFDTMKMVYTQATPSFWPMGQ